MVVKRRSLKAKSGLEVFYSIAEVLRAFFLGKTSLPSPHEKHLVSKNPTCPSFMSLWRVLAPSFQKRSSGSPQASPSVGGGAAAEELPALCPCAFHGLAPSWQRLLCHRLPPGCQLSEGKVLWQLRTPPPQPPCSPPAPPPLAPAAQPLPPSWAKATCVGLWWGH